MRKRSPHLSKALHGADQEDNVLYQIRHPHPELAEVICVLWDSVLSVGKKHTDVSAGTDAEEAEIIGQVTYVVRVELAVSGQAVQEPLDVRPEVAVTSRVVDLVQMFSQSVPEVERDFHHLVG